MRIGKEKGVPISPELIGLFFEDINFAADGGLYAEMIENRSFEAREAYGNPGRFYAVDDPGYAWKSVQQSGEEAPFMQYVTGTPVSEANPHYLRFTAKAAGQGFANKAYDGILSLIHISEPTRRTPISYAVFCLKKKKNQYSMPSTA